MVSWLEAAYPFEGCGLILENADGQHRFYGCQNLADLYHQRDPGRFPRSARDFYIIDPREFMWAEARGERVVAIVHSHPDGSAEFSGEDRAGALMPRNQANDPVEPVYPGVDYLILAVQAGRAELARLFSFDPQRQEFSAVWSLDTRALQAAITGKEAGADSGV